MNELRVMGGKYKNIELKVPESARPITTRVKAVIFDTLMNRIEGAIVLDLFAGSGNIGIEALSRGAKSVVFVEHNKEAVEIIENNLYKIGESGEVFKIDYKIFLKKNNQKFDLIFIDPPFDFISELKLRLISKFLHEESVVVSKIDSKSKIKIPIDLDVVYEKKIGENKVIFMKLKADVKP